MTKFNFKAYLTGKDRAEGAQKLPPVKNTPVIFGIEAGHLIAFHNRSNWDTDAYNYYALDSKRGQYFTTDLGVAPAEEPTAAQLIEALNSWNMLEPGYLFMLEKDGANLNTEATEPAAPVQGTDGVIISAIATALNGRLTANTDALKKELQEYTRQLIENRAPREVQHTFIFKDREVRAKKGDVFHAQFERICKYLMKGHAIYLYGPSGTGKSYVAKQVANVLGLTFYLINSVTQEHKITGYSDAAGVFHSTQFTEAFTKGGVLLIDEIDASIPEVLMILNEALANGRICVDGKLLEAHKDFKCITAGNTRGGGANETNGVEYTARYPLDPASLDRFTFIFFDYDKQIERTLPGANDDMVNYIHELRRIVKDRNINGVLLTYRLFARLADAEEIEDTLSDALYYALFNRLEPDVATMIINAVPSRENRYYQATKLIKIAA